MFYNAVKIHVDSQSNLEFFFINPNMIEDKTSLGVKDDENTNIPNKYILKQNFPNPFNSSTTIQFAIPQVKTGHALSLQIIIYDIRGKEIATLVKNINTSGTCSVKWNASGYPSGIYFYQLQNNSGVIATKKMLFLR